MEEYQKRVVEECTALDIKIGALNEFLNFHTIAEEGVLERQLEAMLEYKAILQERIATFGEFS